jgi:hypothetical protein
MSCGNQPKSAISFSVDNNKEFALRHTCLEPALFAVVNAIVEIITCIRVVKYEGRVIKAHAVLRDVCRRLFVIPLELVIGYTTDIPYKIKP